MAFSISVAVVRLSYGVKLRLPNRFFQVRKFSRLAKDIKQLCQPEINALLHGRDITYAYQPLSHQVQVASIER